MPWSTYFLQSIVTWVIGGAISALIGAAAVFFVRRWVKALGWIEPLLNQLTGDQQRTAAQSAAATETAAAANAVARQAHESASAATDRSDQANEAIAALAELTLAQDAVIEDLKTRIDGLLGTRARQLADEHNAARTGQRLIPAVSGTDRDPLTVTGRHRLHTTVVPTHDQGESL